MAAKPRTIPTIPQIIEPYTTAAVVKACGVHPDTARKWRRAELVPGAEFVRPIAELTNTPIEIVLAAVETAIQKRAVA